MQIESALIARARPQILAARLGEVIQPEIQKGCDPAIATVPVALEPRFSPLWMSLANSNRSDVSDWVPETPISSNHWVNLRVWISPEHNLDWNQSELFIKLLQGLKYRCAFQISGNREGVILAFRVHQQDVVFLKAVFKGAYDGCELTRQAQISSCTSLGIRSIGIQFRDFYPPPPYSHLLTRPPELQKSPLQPLITTLAEIDSAMVGVYQLVLQPVFAEHNWHQNVQILLDMEYNAKLNHGLAPGSAYTHQSPSGDLKQMASEVETKAHNDKPFYSVALRVGVMGSGENADTVLDALSAFVALFQHGGRPLAYLTEQDYGPLIGYERLDKLFEEVRSHRPGFLTNSQELTGLVHLPPAVGIDENEVPLDILKSLPVKTQALTAGTPVGICKYADSEIQVCFPHNIRSKHTHLIGRTGMGKSTTQEHMILSDIQRGDGVAVLDPHGDLIQRVLGLIPEKDVERTIYLDPGDPEWIPIWNPLQQIPGQDIGRTADDLVQAIQSFILKSGWGDRLEHLLRNLFFSIMHLPKGTFLDVSNLLRNKSEESKILRREILDRVDNETVRQFWYHDYAKYGKDDLGPPRNKLSKLLISNTVSLMLSQPESLFNFREIMDQGQILLVNLSNVGSMIRSILGCFILSLLHLTALSRSSISIHQRKPFHIHCDEAHRFMTDALEDLIAETRKFKVSLSLAHQYMSQFGRRKTDAFSSVGATIIFNVDSKDAGYLVKDLQKKVKAEDLVSLDVGEAIARIGTDIVRVRTRPPLPITHPNCRDRIIAESRRKYYRPAHEVHRWIRRRGERWNRSHVTIESSTARDKSGNVKEFEYDEF